MPFVPPEFVDFVGEPRFESHSLRHIFNGLGSNVLVQEGVCWTYNQCAVF
jgi:hypothetical protein